MPSYRSRTTKDHSVPCFVINVVYSIFSIGLTWLAITLFFGDLPFIKSGNYLPEEVSIAEGRIVHFETYFDGKRPRKNNRPLPQWMRSKSTDTGSTLGVVYAHPTHAHPTRTPLTREGILVTIAFTDEAGDEKRIDEKWMLPCLDQFENGSVIPVLWHAAKPKPRSIIVARTMPKVILYHASKTTEPSVDPGLRKQRTEELTRIKEDFAPLFDRITKYVDAYSDPAIENWTFEEAKAEWAKTKSAKHSR